MRWWGWLGCGLASVVAIAGSWTLYQSRGRVPALAFGGEDLAIRLKDGVHYLQTDPRWADQLLAKSQGAGTLGGYGCTVSSVAAAMTNLGHPITPDQLNDALAAEGGFTPEGWLIWSAISRVSDGKLRADVRASPSREGVDACLKRGDYPIVKFLIGGVVQHWVTIIGKEDGTYLMRDPLIDEKDPLPLTRRTQTILSVRCIGRSHI